MTPPAGDWHSMPGILLGECFHCGTHGPLRESRFGDFCADGCLETPTVLRKTLLGEPLEATLGQVLLQIESEQRKERGR